MSNPTVCEVCARPTDNKIVAGCNDECFVCQACINENPEVLKDQCAACSEANDLEEKDD